MERVKINSRLEFPRYLDMTEYIEPEQQKQKLDAAVKKLKEKMDIEEESVFMEEDPKESTASDDDEDFEMQEETEELEPADTTTPPPGDNVYELYSILIHSGTADHGHYYAYIKVSRIMPG